ncbi:MAG TPA: xanthine dehydrogenase family protein molybdopterin-binding subunit [Thermodesulfobacteriota bacterium]|nr:xanthine dehydrogenase family protein molybdopterin-binding subunit [Thermodesulfobacteriota bacterium]
MATGARKWVGQPVLRKEDYRFLTGQGRYTDDIVLPGMLHAAFVRSPYAHARIGRIDASRALALPGVVAVLTGEEVKAQTDPFEQMIRAPYDQLRDYCLAVDTAKHAGEAVAAVVAETPYLAADAAELVEVEYEPLPAVTDAEAGMRPEAPRVHPNLPSNVVWHDEFHYGDVDAAFAKADLVVRERLHFHRFTSAPLETSVVIASYDAATGTATIWSNNQRPMLNLPFIAKPLRMPSEKFRFICPDIGGGFGIKNNSYPYLVALVLLSRKVGRPVKWVEQRREHLMASTHGNEVIFDAEMAFAKDGTILGVRARAVHDEGCYMRREPIGAVNFIRHSTVGYRFRNLKMDLYTVLTNKAPVGPNRSYGKMQQCYLIERLIEAGARRLGLDPVEIRLRNFVRPEEMPYENASGCILDGGDYPGMMRRVMELFDYEGAKRLREEARREGRLVGIGVAMGMDACPINASLIRVIDERRQTSGDSEAAWIRIDEHGGITAATGSVPQGQGFETTVAQLVADGLGVTPDDVHVLPGFDSASHPYSAFSGTYASRFAVVGAGAVVGACERLRAKIVRIAAHLLEAAEADIELADGAARVRGTNRSMTLQQIARVAWRDLARLPDDLEAGLFAHYVYRPKFEMPKENKRGNFSLTYSYAISMALVEVDPGTGAVKVLRFATVDDFGRRLNPLILEGQIHGAIGHQLGAALYEHLHYNEEGQLLASTFKDYWVPTAADFPEFLVGYHETPSTATPLGTRGGGEGGGSPLIAAVNAVDDALAPLGGHVTDSFLAPEAILREIRKAGAGIAGGAGGA